MTKFLKRALIAFGVLALLLAVLYVGWDISSRRTLAAAKERLRAAGLPLTADDIQPPPVPDADNAALVMARLDALIEALPPVNGSNFKQWSADFTSRHLMYHLDETAAKELALQFDSPHMQAVLALIREAVGKAGYDAKGDYFTPATAARRLGEAGHLLSWDVRLSARLRDTETACQGIWDALTLAEHLSNEAGMLARQTRFAIWSGVIREIEQLAAQDGIPPVWAKKFADRLAALDHNWGWARAIDGDRILLGQWSFEVLLTAKFDRKKLGEQPDSWREWFHQQRYSMPQWIRIEYADYLDYMREYRIAALARY